MKDMKASWSSCASCFNVLIAKPNAYGRLVHMTKRLLLSAVLFTAACSTAAPKPLTMAELPDINTDRILQDIKILSSDEYEGRAPGSRGEALTTAYLVDQFKTMGLEPGNPDGSWTQKVSLVGLTAQPQGGFIVKNRKGTASIDFNINRDVVVFSRRVTDEVKLENSELVFAGYGVQAPEFGWDDFKGLDVKGKTIVVLVNDPPVTKTGSTDLDDSVFGGRAMTYYGRWTYKYDKGAELGAAGVIVVHETGPAGYPFSVVQGFSTERFNLVTPDRNMGTPSIQAWISVEAATALFKIDRKSTRLNSSH